MGRLRLRHWLTTTSLLALASGAAQAQTCGAAGGGGGLTISSNQGSCSNSAAVNYITVNSGVTVSGSITNTGAIQSTVIHAVGVTGTVTGGIINSGTIKGGSVYTGVYVRGPGKVTNSQGALIGGYHGVDLGGGTIVNSGSIRGNVAVYVRGNLTLSNYGSGAISSAAANAPGVYVTGSGTITNAGTITSALERGIQLNAGGTVTNSGLIMGARGIYIQNAAATVTNTGTIMGTGNPGISFVNFAGTLINSGTISGGNGVAVQFGAANSTLMLQSGSVLNGTVTGVGSNNTLILQGINVTSALATQLAGFGSSATIQGADNTIAGTISFAGMTVQGGLTIDGNVTASSVAVGSGGSIAVGDAATPGAMLTGSVALSGGTLSGHGTVVGNVTNTGGTVSPGGTIGTLTITGNYVQSANGTLAIELSPTAASKLAISGTASLAGSLALTVDPGTFVSGTKYAILTAGGGVTGGFAQSTIAVSPLLSLTSSYLPGEVDLTVQLASLAALADTPNRRAVGAVLDQLAAAPAFAPVIGAMVALSTTTQLRGALDQVGVAAESYGDLARTNIQTGQALTGLLSQQLFMSHGAAAGGGALAQAPGGATRVQLASLDPVAQRAEGPAPGPAPGAMPPASPWSAWLSGFGVFGAIGGNGNAHALNYSTGGTAFGIDYRLDPALLVGAFAAYGGAGTSASGLPGSGTIDSYAGGVYASWSNDRLYVDAMLGYQYDDDHLTRTIAFPGFSALNARASSYGNQFLSSLETGRSYDLPDSDVATPFVGLQAVTLDQASFSETGAGALDLAVGGQSTSSVRTQLGSRFSRDVELGEGHVVNLGLKLGWAHERSDTGTTTAASFSGAPGASFSVQGAQRGRDSALVGVGIASALDGQSSVYLRYDGDIDGSDNAHAVIGGVRLTW